MTGAVEVTVGSLLAGFPEIQLSPPPGWTMTGLVTNDSPVVSVREKTTVVPDVMFTAQMNGELIRLGYSCKARLESGGRISRKNGPVPPSHVIDVETHWFKLTAPFSVRL